MAVSEQAQDSRDSHLDRLLDDLSDPFADPKPPKNNFAQDLTTQFERKRQILGLFRKQILRWLLTAALLSLVILSLRIYEQKGYIPSAAKAAFNVVQTALNIGLGLNFFDAFKDLAKVLRWWLLARFDHDIHEVDLILGFDNLKNVFILGWRCRRRGWMLLFCIGWLLINFTSIAIISLTYNMDDGTNWNGTYTTPGVAKAANLTGYFNGEGTHLRLSNQTYQAAVHSYGELARSRQCGPYNEISDIETSRQDYGYYCRRTPGRQQFAYRFSEYNPKDLRRRYPLFTNRVITASAGQCYEYTGEGVTDTKDESGENAREYKFTNGSVTGHIIIPKKNDNPEGTTYIHRGENIPERANGQFCGSRCMWVWAHKSAGGGEPSVFYQCPVTVSTVNNLTNDTQTISDDDARLAASSIALSGIPALKDGRRIWTQYQFYSFGSPWEVHFLTADKVGANMAEFAIGSLSTMAFTNPLIDVDGLVPYLGSCVKIQWKYLIALVICIAGVHFLLFLSAITIARAVIIKDDSNLSVARLLHPMIDVLGNSGTVMGSKELSAAIQKSYARGVVYGPQDFKDSSFYALSIGADVIPRKHPDGAYI